MRIAVTGASGQLGKALQRALSGVHEVVPLSHADLDLERPDCVQ
ncbi:MAG: sugar nucleotide-binding protein, partial [Roseiflexus sp.]|nr:sugar nucleotide-binding protein [Roseiflexus sp.]